MSRPSSLVAIGLGAIALLVPLRAPALKIQQRSVSSSKQFIVYCDDAPGRIEVTTYVEEAKSALLNLLGQPDQWKIPIVVNLERAASRAVDEPASQVRLFDIGDGSKIEIDVWLKTAEPKNIRFEQQLVKAMLIEMEYRGRPPVKSGAAYTEPPAWLVEGIVENIRDRDSGVDPAVYEGFMDGNQLPPIKDFLAESGPGADDASAGIYRACALSLVRLLVGMPDGREGLQHYIAALPDSTGTPEAGLLKHFPSLGETDLSLEKWWTLGIARLSTLDRYRGLTTEATEQKLASLLTLEIHAGKDGTLKTYSITDYKEYRKLPESRAALQRLEEELLALSPEASPLFRTVVLDYQKIVYDLRHGKMRGIQRKLDTAASDRKMIVGRIGQISDYMNWFEATQMDTPSNSFNGYLEIANQSSEPRAQRDDPISKYLDSVELGIQ